MDRFVVIDLHSKFYVLLDFGAGIGRVTKHFLLSQFEVVDIVEQCENFTSNVHVYLVGCLESLKTLLQFE